VLWPRLCVGVQELSVVASLVCVCVCPAPSRIPWRPSPLWKSAVSLHPFTSWLLLMSQMQSVRLHSLVGDGHGLHFAAVSPAELALPKPPFPLAADLSQLPQRPWWDRKDGCDTWDTALLSGARGSFGGSTMSASQLRNTQAVKELRYSQEGSSPITDPTPVIGGGRSEMNRS
jgi:hypothetical protein